MKVKIISIGKIKEKCWQLAEVDFTKRIQRYVKFQQISVKDASAEAKNLDTIKKIEGQRILDKITSDDFVIVLDKSGSQMESMKFAEFLQNKMLHGISKFTFVIGGPEGLAKDLIDKANLHLSLSKMTFPHELFKVMLLEQIYRSLTIIKGEKYHK